MEKRSQGLMRWWLGPNTRAVTPTYANRIPYQEILIKKGGTSDYGVSSRDNHTIYLITMTCLPESTTRLIFGYFRQTPTLTIRDPVFSDHIHEA